MTKLLAIKNWAVVAELPHDDGPNQVPLVMPTV
jgi:hypothetical protein